MPVERDDQRRAAHPVRHVAAGVPTGKAEDPLDVREMRRRRLRNRRRSGNPPGRHSEGSRLVPTLGFDQRFDAITAFARLEVHPLGAHAIVERRQRDDGPFRRLDEHERRGQAAVALRTDEIAARERIAEQHLVVARIEKRRAGGR